VEDLDDDNDEFAAGFLDALDFEAEHGEPLGYLFNRISIFNNITW